MPDPLVTFCVTAGLLAEISRMVKAPKEFLKYDIFLTSLIWGIVFAVIAKREELSVLLWVLSFLLILSIAIVRKRIVDTPSKGSDQ